jgi:hypothetical protein
LPSQMSFQNRVKYYAYIVVTGRDWRR